MTADLGHRIDGCIRRCKCYAARHKKGRLGQVAVATPAVWVAPLIHDCAVIFDTMAIGVRCRGSLDKLLVRVMVVLPGPRPRRSALRQAARPGSPVASPATTARRACRLSARCRYEVFEHVARVLRVRAQHEVSPEQVVRARVTADGPEHPRERRRPGLGQHRSKRPAEDGKGDEAEQDGVRSAGLEVAGALQALTAEGAAERAPARLTRRGPRRRSRAAKLGQVRPPLLAAPLGRAVASR
jgi:hypothetical protein